MNAFPVEEIAFRQGPNVIVRFEVQARMLHPGEKIALSKGDDSTDHPLIVRFVHVCKIKHIPAGYLSCEQNPNARDQASLLKVLVGRHGNILGNSVPEQLEAVVTVVGFET